MPGQAVGSRVPNLAVRNNILDLEEAMQGIDTVTDWSEGMRHHFGEGTYVREVKRYADSVIVSKIHRHSCVNILMSGKMSIESEFESEIYEAPSVWVSPARNKRAIYYLEDSQFMTVHANPSNTRDLAVLEKELIAEDYESLGVEG